MMDESIVSYLGIRELHDVDERWSEIIELESLRNISQQRSSTRMIQIHWGNTSILIAEERYYESL